MDITFTRDGQYDIDGWVARIDGIKRYMVSFRPVRPSGWDWILFRRYLGDGFDKDQALLEQIRTALFSEHKDELTLENMEDIVVWVGPRL